MFASCKVGAGRYFITYNDSIDIPADEIRRDGVKLPIKLRGFISFVKNNMLDTTESCALLKCSRQNLFYMVRQDQLAPVKEEVKGNLYLKGDVVRNSW